MKFNKLEYKKPFYKIKAPLREHLKQYSRLDSIPIKYEDLLNFDQLIPITDSSGEPTLWYSVIYRQDEQEYYHNALKEIYQKLLSEGDQIPYLRIDSIDFCSFGNSKPLRVKIINEINDIHDYFYVKKADASRIYGLELEEIFSPDKVNYIVDNDTLIEEHIVGIPVDEYIKKYDKIEVENRLRFAKEFVKFNERCFIRLLGDMRAYNFVVEITHDFDNLQYRLRAMDFDQQSYEGRMNIYKPQFFKDNYALVKLASELLTLDVVNQYRRIERVAMKKRYFSAKHRTKSLLRRMKKDKISSPVNINQLKKDLAKHHGEPSFLQFTNMGEILNLHLEKSLNIQILTGTKII
jgi:hypothetical protein